MFIQMKPRKYTLKQRAEEQERTRARIVEAAMQLHGELGPRATSISAIAERAGVQRLTVYRHFPDDAALFRACSSHWIELNPPPDPAMWRGLTHARERTRAVLGALYAYYRRTADMWTGVHRDADLPAMQAPLSDFFAYLDGLAADLTAAWQPRGRKSKPLKAAARHAVEFGTWRSLQAHALGDAQAAELVTSWLAASVPGG